MTEDWDRSAVALGAVRRPSEIPFLSNRTGAGKGLTPFPAYPVPGRGRISDGLLTAPRAAADRYWTTTYRVWTGTIEIRPTLISARRPTRHFGLGDSLRKHVHTAVRVSTRVVDGMALAT